MAARDGWLTCDAVEDLQQAAAIGRPTGMFISSLKVATLPGIVEYGYAK
jgi:hypothetical protein